MAGLDLRSMSEDQMNLLMQQISLAKKQKLANRTPSDVPRPQPPPDPEYQNPPAPSRQSANEGRGQVRAGHRRDSGSSEELEALDNFYKDYIASDLPDDEWLYVSPVFRNTEAHKKMPVSDWLKIGSEDDLAGYSLPRKVDHRSPSPSLSMSRYRSPPSQPSPLAAPPPPPLQDPLNNLDLFKISSTRSRYVEEMERRRSMSSPPSRSSPPMDPPDTPESNPQERQVRQSPDWTRIGAISPQTPLDRTVSPRQIPQDYNRQISPGPPHRQSPSPKLSRGDSPLQRMNPLAYRRPGEDRVHSPESRVVPTQQIPPGMPQLRTAMRPPSNVRSAQGRSRLQQPMRSGMYPPRGRMPPT